MKMTKLYLDSPHGPAMVSTSTQDPDLDVMIELCERLLRGAGYVFDGELTIDAKEEEAGRC